MKELVGKEIATRLKDGEIVGVGTGSTVEVALKFMGERIKADRLKVAVVPTSYQTSWLCSKLGFEVLDPNYTETISWGFDGADVVDKNLSAIKGRGGAMLQEKILAAKCNYYILIVDQAKCTDILDSRYYVPIEIVPTALGISIKGLQKLGAMDIKVREGTGKHGPVITEAGNLVIDAKFSSIPHSLEAEIKSVLGVVESGLFLNYASEVLIGEANQVKSIKK